MKECKFKKEIFIDAWGHERTVYRFYFCDVCTNFLIGKSKTFGSKSHFEYKSHSWCVNNTLNGHLQHGSVMRYFQNLKQAKEFAISHWNN